MKTDRPEPLELMYLRLLAFLQRREEGPVPVKMVGDLVNVPALASTQHMEYSFAIDDCCDKGLMTSVIVFPDPDSRSGEPRQEISLTPVGAMMVHGVPFSDEEHRLMSERKMDWLASWLQRENDHG